MKQPYSIGGSRDMTIVTVICAVLLGVLPVCSFAQNVLSRPVGFVRIEVPPQAERLVALPFDPFTNTINAVFEGQMTGSSESSRFDRIFKWNNAGQIYVSAHKVDGKWYSDVCPSDESEMTLDAGEGFWLVNHQDLTQTVYLVGQIVLASTRETVFRPALTLFGSPYSTALRPSDFLKGEPTSHPEGEGGSDDRIPNGTWINSDSDALLLGKGYWYHLAGNEALVSNLPRPYENLFPVNDEPPRIRGMRVVEAGEAMELDIMCSGSEGETLDMFFQDLTERTSFDTSKKWTLGASWVPSEGFEHVIWTDRGDADRATPSTVFARYYLVARGDIDSDEDGISDAREILLGNEGAHGPHDSDHEQSDNKPGQVDAAPTANSPEESPVPVSGRKIFVDCRDGDDRFAGLQMISKNGDGPKRTIAAALKVASKGDDISVGEGTYFEKASLFGVTLTTRGDVIIQ